MEEKVTVAWCEPSRSDDLSNPDRFSRVAKTDSNYFSSCRDGQISEEEVSKSESAGYFSIDSDSLDCLR